MSASGDTATCGCCGTGGGAPEWTMHNRPGLDALTYRVAMHAAAMQRMLARLPLQTAEAVSDSGQSGAVRPLAALTAGGAAVLPDDGADSDPASQQPLDPAIALLDAWAVVGDVLSFYQERIANEGYLRTATERRSVLELARAIGYELNPGVAASTSLAFTVEDAAGAPGIVTLDAGLRVQSLPAQNERPQTFETVERIDARAEWNALRPRLTVPQTMWRGRSSLYLRGAPRLEPGDMLLVVGDERLADPGSERWDLRVLAAVISEPAADRTRVEFVEGLGNKPYGIDPATSRPRAFVLRQRAALFGHNAPDWRTLPGPTKAAFWDPAEHVNPDNPGTYPPNRPSNSSSWGLDWPAYANFAIRTPSQKLIDLDAPYPKLVQDGWVALVRPGYTELYRIAEAKSLTRSDWLITAKVTRLKLDTDENLSTFGLRETTVFGQSEELELTEEPVTTLVSGSEIVLDRLVSAPARGRSLLVTGRRRRVRVGPTPPTSLALSAPPLSVPLKAGDVLWLLAPPTLLVNNSIQWQLVDRNGFEGKVIAAAGVLAEEPSSPSDPTIVELATLDATGTTPDGRQTTISLAAPLRNLYEPATLVIHANVARATHGESVVEVLGSGDGAVANQRFALKKPPLTWVAAPTARGSRSTLGVRVNGVLWSEAPSLYGLPSDAQRYVLRIDDDGRTTVLFGDGRSGARPPSGTENIVAAYRSGIGPEGEVAAGAITLLQTRPLGLRGVTNPLPSTGAAAPERLENARANAPLTVLTLDRVVSLRDFEDFVRAFSGIGKSRAVALWSGRRRLVHVTVAAEGGRQIGPDDALFRLLSDAVDAAREPTQPVALSGYRLRTFNVAARILVDPRYLGDDVRERVTRRLRHAFGFARRDFGQAVGSAEVIAEIQGVAGVVAADLEVLALDATPDPRAVTAPPLADDVTIAGAPTDPLDWRRLPSLASPTSKPQPLSPLLARAAERAQSPGSGDPEFLGAELLLINPAGIVLNEVSA